jgi:predicted XRE-type DNA-binding protein
MSGKNWKDDPLENTPPVRGSGSFLKDRGYSDPTQTKIKFELVCLIRNAVEAKGLRQTDVAEIVNRFDRNVTLSQPDVSRILRGNVKGYSESRLMAILAALGNDVSIVIKPVKGRGHISISERELAVA